MPHKGWRRQRGCYCGDSERNAGAAAAAGSALTLRWMQACGKRSFHESGQAMSERVLLERMRESGAVAGDGLQQKKKRKRTLRRVWV